MIKTMQKNVRALIGSGEVKATKADDFLCLNPMKFSTRVLIKCISINADQCYLRKRCAIKIGTEFFHTSP